MRLATTTVVAAFSPLFLLSPHAGSAPAVTPVAAARILPRGGEQFAAAIAVSGGDVLVSSLGFSTFRGVNGVHVFRRTGTGTGASKWAEADVLTPGDSLASERFGAALSADGPLLAVLDPDAAPGAGAIYIFERDRRRRWHRRARLIIDAVTDPVTPGAAQPAASGHGRDYVVLRRGILVVGVQSAAGGPDQVVIFRRGADAARWAVERAVTPTGAEQFGTTAAIVDDRLVVSAPGSPTALARPNRLYVLRDSAGTWVAETMLDPPAAAIGADTAQHTFFRPGELLGEGTDLWVGYPEGERGRGVVLHFRRTARVGARAGAGASGTWTLLERRTAAAPDTLPNLDFGVAFARAGGDLIASAPAADREAGVLHVFRAHDAAGSAAHHRFGTTPPVPWSKLGVRLATAGNLLAAVAPRRSGGVGMVVVFERGAVTGDWRQVATLSAPLPAPLARTITGPRPCTAGQVQGFDCKNVELLSFLPARELGATVGGTLIQMTISGMWGWTDTATHREFALIGRVDGTAFVEVTDPAHPKYLGALPLHSGAHPSLWRDIKVYQHHAFIVADQAGPHGMQIFDLTQLRDVKHAPVTFAETAHYDQFGTAHTLALDEATGYAYAVLAGGGGETCGGQLHMIDVRNPVKPVFAGCYANPAMSGTHETECVVYHGPDAKYQGHELCFNANGWNGLEIVDVTDKKAPKSVSVATYPNVRYTHQGWLTEDQRYFFLNDEHFFRNPAEDPSGAQGHTRTVVFDLQEVEDPVLAEEFFSSASAAAHNLYIRGHYVYESNYKAGLRVYDITDPKHPGEVAYLDTTPGEANDAEFAGSWSNYPYFRSGAVGVVSMAEGLFLVRPQPPQP